MVEKQKSAGAIIYYLDEKNKPNFLLLQNTLRKTYWEFPKGKIEDNENIEKTVRREVEEETNLRDIKIIRGFKHFLKWFYQFGGKTIFKEAVYLIAKIKPEDKFKVKISNEHEKFEWMNYEKAMKETNKASNKEMLKKAYDFILEVEKQKSLF
jgi:8-oxo-dGTP pyrophosphatase MutT (NUDIX family)